MAKIRKSSGQNGRSRNDGKKNEQGRFGTFGGVFVPNILTILGVIMYLRLGWVVGNAGLYRALLILGIANLITLVTSFSMSAIATNMKVKGGGAYYMISRSLGAEAGGSVGFPLYLAQALGISLYIVGFAESVNHLFPGINTLLITLSTMSLLTLLALISSGLVIKIQYIILSVILLSLVSFFLGRSPEFSEIHLQANFTGEYDFWGVFAVFFPAVTGILSGVSLSGDLKDPARSIPRGTLFSVLAGAVIYVGLAVWLSVVSSPDELTGNNEVMITLARYAPLVYAGIWGATLSSALANILAAPRTLQALAGDGLFLRIFHRGRGKENEPVIATVFTFVLVCGVLTVGDLNSIAPVLTVFFLITYGSINLISFAEGLIRRPGYRPSFRVHWSVSLAGAAACVWVMFIINPLACVAGFAFVGVIYLILTRIRIQKNWGDVRRGLWSALIQFSVYSLEKLRDHPATWRPQVLLIGKDVSSSSRLVQIAFGLTRQSGFMTCIDLFRRGETATGKMEEATMRFRALEEQHSSRSFHKNILVDDYPSGQLVAPQVHGIGEFRHNTILMDWKETLGGIKEKKPGTGEDPFSLIRFYSEMKNSLLLLNAREVENFSGYRKVDLWWDPAQRNGSFMFLLSYLLASGRLFREPQLTIKTVVLREKQKVTRDLLEELVQKSRIKADIKVIHPEYLEEVLLSAEYEKEQSKKDRQNRLISRLQKFSGLRRLWRSLPGPSEESRKEAQVASIQEKSNEDPGEDEVLKEKLSEQLQEKDRFIIDRNIRELIHHHSGKADLVMLGFNIPEAGQEKKYIEKMEALLEDLPDALLVNCPYDIKLFD
jgi:amino acid transporter